MSIPVFIFLNFNLLVQNSAIGQHFVFAMSSNLFGKKLIYKTVMPDGLSVGTIDLLINMAGSAIDILYNHEHGWRRANTGSNVLTALFAMNHSLIILGHRTKM